MIENVAHDGLKDALVILGAAGIVIPAFARIRITPIIGFLLVGILVGPMGLGAFSASNPWLSWITIGSASDIHSIGEYGVIMLLFSIGLELSFKRLWIMRQQIFGLGAAELIGGALVIAMGLRLFGYGWSAAFGLGVALSLSSTALILPLAGTKTAVGRGALAMLLFEDIAIVPIIFILGALAPQAGSSSLTALLNIIWQGLAVVGGLAIAGHFLLPRMFGQAARTKSPELFMSASLLVVIVSSMLTRAIGLSPIFGALIAGLLIARTDYRGEVESVTAPFMGLALGVFLISIGMQIDLRYVANNWAKLCAAITAVIAVNAVVTAALLRIAGARQGVAAETGLLMASPSETTLIVLGAATMAHVIAPETSQFWQVATVIGLLVTPILARVGHDISRRLEYRTRQHELDEEISGDGSRTVILGFGRVGQLVADMLKVHNQPYIAVESDIDSVLEQRASGYTVIYGDVSHSNILSRLKLIDAKALVLTMNEPVLAARIVQSVRLDYPDLKIVARARDTDHAAELYRVGASDAVPETLESSLQLSEAVLVDLGVAMGPVIASIHEKRDEYRKAIMEGGELEEAPRLKLRSRLATKVEI
jgi:monovalent cation:H+ antiporter-2, CPA2 family